MSYQHDPHAAPDGDFASGLLAHLVVGNAGRWQDPRRTPVRVVAVHEPSGCFSLEVLAFEDQGAVWELPFENVGSFQFALDAALLAPEALARYQAIATHFDRPLAIACDPTTLAETDATLTRYEATAAAWLLAAASPQPDFTAVQGNPLLWAELGRFLAERDVADMDEAFTRQFTSNPAAGELVKGHRVVLAELGLVPFAGKVIRDVRTFAGAWHKDRRRAHILWRLAFTRAMLARAGHTHLVLYRGLSTPQALELPRNQTFVSATTNAAIAQALYAPPGHENHLGVLIRQPVPITRIFMTYQETAALNGPYLEAEAVLLHEPGNLAF